MNTAIWVVVGVGLAIALFFVYYVIVQIARAREDFKRIDYSRIRRWKDDDW